MNASPDNDSETVPHRSSSSPAPLVGEDEKHGRQFDIN